MIKAAASPSPSAQLTEGRRYDLDWLRAIAILILLFFHTGMWFNTWGWHVKNAQLSHSFEHWMILLHYWRMPLLLFISGAGTYMALGKRTPGQFAGERFKRLFIPLIFGMCVIVPPQIYYERINLFNGYWDFYKTVFQFTPYPEGSFSWHHLWFICYLFFFSLIAIPLLKYLRSDQSKKFKDMVYKLCAHPVALLFIPSLVILITQIILRPYFPEQTHALIGDWAFFTFYFAFFIFGMMAYSDKRLWKRIGDSRKQLLIATILITIPFYVCWFDFHEIIALPWSDDTVETMFDVVAIFLSWFWVITIIAYGQHCLNRPHPILKYVNEGLYPFYISHQTVIIAIGYYICQLPWSIVAKYFIISLLTLISCVSFYFLIIRPFNGMRFLFGLKRKSNS